MTCYLDPSRPLDERIQELLTDLACLCDRERLFFDGLCVDAEIAAVEQLEADRAATPPRKISRWVEEIEAALLDEEVVAVEKGEASCSTSVPS